MQREGKEDEAGTTASGGLVESGTKLAGFDFFSLFFFFCMNLCSSGEAQRLNKREW